MNPYKLLNLTGTLVSLRASKTWDPEVKQIYISNFSSPLRTADKALSYLQPDSSSERWAG